jgi:hypothetical protein
MKYHVIEPIERADAEAILAGADLDAVCVTLISLALYEPELSWVQYICVQHAKHESPYVRHGAIVGLGHLARIHRDKALLSAQPILEGLLKDPESAGVAGDALDDFKTFLKPRKRRG